MTFPETIILCIHFISLFCVADSENYEFDISVGLGRQFDGVGAISGGGVRSRVDKIDRSWYIPRRRIGRHWSLYTPYSCCHDTTKKNTGTGKLRKCGMRKFATGKVRKSSCGIFRSLPVWNRWKMMKNFV